MTRSTAIAALVLTGTILAPVHAGEGCGSTATASARLVSNDSSWKKDIVDTAVEAGSFRTLAAALEAADLVGALKGDGPFTVFAPTDDAFHKLPAGTVKSLLRPENKKMLAAILTYHVVPGRLAAADVVRSSGATTLNGQRAVFGTKGRSVMIDGAKIVKTDIECGNGIIHVIDQVIMPSPDSILDTAASAGSFTLLTAALDAAGLTKTLAGDGPFTVFAPTDEAFAKLPAGTVESLLRPENRHQLIDVLTYHVVPGRVFARDAVSAESARTVQGSDVGIRIVDGRVRIGSAGLLKADIQATNGVIHVIDEVILPPAS